MYDCTHNLTEQMHACMSNSISSKFAHSIPDYLSLTNIYLMSVTKKQTSSHMKICTDDDKNMLKLK